MPNLLGNVNVLPVIFGHLRPGREIVNRDIGAHLKRARVFQGALEGRRGVTISLAVLDRRGPFSDELARGDHFLAVITAHAAWARYFQMVPKPRHRGLFRLPDVERLEPSQSMESIGIKIRGNKARITAAEGSITLERLTGRGVARALEGALFCFGDADESPGLHNEGDVRRLRERISRDGGATQDEFRRAGGAEAPDVAYSGGRYVIDDD